MQGLPRTNFRSEGAHPRLDRTGLGFLRSGCVKLMKVNQYTLEKEAFLLFVKKSKNIIAWVKNFFGGDVA